jgi:serine/threonine protein kinase
MIPDYPRGDNERSWAHDLSRADQVAKRAEFLRDRHKLKGEDARPEGRAGEDPVRQDAGPPQSPEFIPQPQIPGYKILRVIGRGGMGVVYKAEDVALGRVVALKVLPSVAATMNPRRLPRFEREAKAGARLHHANIVPVYRKGEHEGVHYFAMEYISGPGLNTIIKKLKRQPRQPTGATPAGSGLRRSAGKGLPASRLSRLNGYVVLR